MDKQEAQGGGEKMMKAIRYEGPYKVALREVPFPKLIRPEDGKPINHAVILKVVLSCICGSDLHMTRGRTNAKPGFTLGHEITGEVYQVESF